MPGGRRLRWTWRAATVGAPGRGHPHPEQQAVPAWLQNKQGSIVLDGRNLLELGLDDVRGRIAAIPQVGGRVGGPGQIYVFGQMPGTPCGRLLVTCFLRLSGWLRWKSCG